MAKKVKFPLKMADDTQVRTLEELRERFDLATVLSYYNNKKLQEWLEDRYYESEAEKVKALEPSSPNLKQQLCEILGVQYSEEKAASVDLTKIAAANDKREKLKQFTADDEILKNADRVAFTQKDIIDLLDKGVEEIYLYGDSFGIPLKKKEGVKYIGINNPLVNIKANELIAPEVVAFEGVRFCESYAKLLQMENLHTGEIVQFSGYEWLVLDVQNTKALLLSKAILGYSEYHNEKGNITWATCSLRTYLQKKFYSLLNADTRARIVETHVKNNDNPRFGTHGGIDTVDKVFLLSVEEADTYLKDNAARVGFDIKSGLASWWWLRSPGFNGYSATNVNNSGGIGIGGYEVSNGGGGVRPAMWLELKEGSKQDVSKKENTAVIYYQFGGYDWLVLDERDGKALLLSKEILGSCVYHDENEDVTWEECYLRHYLNNDFLNSFSESDRERIAETYVINSDNPEYGTNGGENTQDRIFLLSYDEEERYCRDSQKRKAYFGEYVDGVDARWWLRTPGQDERCAAYVYMNVHYGAIQSTDGRPVYYDLGVRPALWLKL
jgi:hypothetical protein